MNRYIANILNIIVLTASIVMAGCSDPRFDFEPSGSGSSAVSLDLSFDDYGAVSHGSRAAEGDAIESISEVCVVAYSLQGEYVAKHYAAAGQGLEYSDSHKSKATLKFDLPYGNYHIYAVANMGDLSDYDAQMGSEAEFRSIRFGWNSADAGANSQMCGFVTEGAETAVIANRQAPVVKISSEVTALHSYLRRAASKVTIAYDGSALNENVFVYIKSAQIRDIPRTVTMVERNVPQVDASGQNLDASACLVQGDTINYLTVQGDYASSRVSLAKGSPYGGLSSADNLDQAHGEKEKSLFFFENMQGKSPNKHVYQNFEKKDGMDYGTYLEVKAYYVNQSKSNPSKGEITYRYMLGMNDTDDFNAQRNTHYKVTLRFVNDANNPDWHIDYKLPGPPDVQIPSPLYISYLYNQKLEIPVTAYFDNSQYYVKHLKAEIVSNEYTFPGHQYSGVTSAAFGGKNYNWTENKYGFLSFNNFENNTSINTTLASSYQGVVEKGADDFAEAEYDETLQTWHYRLPIYTRPLNLMVPDQSGNLTDLGFSGNNHFTHQERNGQVRLTIEIGSHATSAYSKSITVDVNVKQVKRVVNPKGCWRPHDSDKPFTFTLMETEEDANTVNGIYAPDLAYMPIRSAGPWTARVYTENYHGAGKEYQPGVSWIKLSPKGKGQWVGSESNPAQVSGSTNSLVEFDFKPAGTIGKDETRFGVIEVLYHDNQCRHLIFVSQGFGTVRMGSADWMMGNLYANGEEVRTPVAEGSMFKYGTSTYALRAANNYTLSVPDRAGGAFRDGRNVDFYWEQRAYSASKGFYLPDASQGASSYKKKYGEVASDIAGFTSQGMTLNSADPSDKSQYRIADYNDYKELLDVNRFGTLFGVLYGEEMSYTPTYHVDRYVNSGDPSGMRGCFIYDRATGNHLFLPIGATGIGRRKVYYSEASGTKMYNMLKYANRDEEMPVNIATPRPLMHDIYKRPGAIYWFRSMREEGSKRSYGLDINYFTYLLNVFETQIIYYYGSDSNYAKFKNLNTYPKPPGQKTDFNSDAAFLRRIRI